MNPGEYWENVESVRVLENCPDEYRKIVESVSTGKLLNPGDYREKVESVRVPKNCQIRASTGKRWNPCEYLKFVRTSTEKW